ncbi:MAG: hypothetical protein IGR76_01270 [Synechococcales cyanobacterium T60_A2020_003]|nr:hypothetical protein [Synechococcales cyanobacterium T60_A2020_003]
MGLSDKVSDQAVQANLTADCVKLIDQQVAAKGGVSGFALKTAYGVVKGIGPDYIPGAIQRLLPEALAALEPMWDEGVQSGDPVQYLSQNSEKTANMLLSVTDSRIERSNNGVVRTSYSKLRNSVKGDIEKAVPDLAKILGTHIQD